MHLAPLSALPRPEWIVLGVNNLCNLHCRMCDVGTRFETSNFYTNLVGTRPVDMPLDLITRVIDQTARQFPGTKLGYAFTEPLIYPYLSESLEYAHGLGLYTAVTTNALMLSGCAEALVQAGLDDIFISLDGPPDIHNFTRGNRRSFQRVMAGIEALLGFRQSPGISVFCVITEWNIGRLAAFIDYFRHIPLRRLGFLHQNFTTREVADGHNLLYGDLCPATESGVAGVQIEKLDLDLLWREIQAITGSDYSFPVSFSPNIHTRERLDLYYTTPHVPFGKQCRDIFRNIMVKSDGTVIPAHGRCYNLPVGNLYEQDLAAIWCSGALNRFRTVVASAGGLLPACARCCSAFG